MAAGVKPRSREAVRVFAQGFTRTRNVKRWSSPSMALRWTAAAMHEAKKGFRRLKAFRQLPALRAALAAHYEKETNSHAVAQNAKAA
jgi:putative transposase